MHMWWTVMLGHCLQSKGILAYNHCQHENWWYRVTWALTFMHFVSSLSTAKMTCIQLYLHIITVNRQKCYYTVTWLSCVGDIDIDIMSLSTGKLTCIQWSNLYPLPNHVSSSVARRWLFSICISNLYLQPHYVTTSVPYYPLSLLFLNLSIHWTETTTSNPQIESRA